MDNDDGVITKYQNGLGIDNKLKLTTNGTSRYFLQDHLGSTTGLTNSSGNITESTTYDAFGNASNNLTTRYSYTGREYDNFTGLYYYRARFYDAKLGRFISEDPIGFAGGDVNLFGYVGNNPQNFVDPSGLFPFFFSPNLIPSSTGSPHKPNQNLDCVEPECRCVEPECRKDIEDMVRDMENLRDELNSSGRRVSDGWGNNFRKSLNEAGNIAANFVAYFHTGRPLVSPPFNPNIEGCTGQTYCLQKKFTLGMGNNHNHRIERGHDLLGYKDITPIEFPFSIQGSSHKWVKAIPNNPKCPKIRLDIWDNSWEIIP